MLLPFTWLSSRPVFTYVRHNALYTTVVLGAGGGVSLRFAAHPPACRGGWTTRRAICRVGGVPAASYCMVSVGLEVFRSLAGYVHGKVAPTHQFGRISNVRVCALAAAHAPSARCSAFTRVARPCRSVWPPRAPPPSSCFNAALPPTRAAATAVETAVEKAVETDVETDVEKGVHHIVHQGRAAGNMAEARRRPKHDEGGGARGDDQRRSVMIGVGGGGSERGHAFSIDTPTQHPLTTNCAKRLWY